MKSLFISFSLIFGFSFLIKWFFHTDLGLLLFFRIYVIDLLRRVLSLTCFIIDLSTISFFVSFRIDSSNDKVR